MNYKSKYLKYKLKYLTTKKLYSGTDAKRIRKGGMVLDSEMAQEAEEEEENKKADKAKKKKKGSTKPVTTQRTPIPNNLIPPVVSLGENISNKPPSTGNLGTSPSIESDKEQNSEIDDFSIGTPQIPLKKK